MVVRRKSTAGSRGGYGDGGGTPEGAVKVPVNGESPRAGAGAGAGSGSGTQASSSSSSSGAPKRSNLWSREGAGVALCALGIVGTLVCYGVLQERLMTIPYGGEGKGNYFKYSLFIVMVNRTFTFLAALVTSLAKARDDAAAGVGVEPHPDDAGGIPRALRPIAPLYAYCAVSASNVVATSCQYEALKFVTFPVQTLAKTAKMVPVMLWGSLILMKRYSWQEYAMAVAVTGGCTTFLLSGKSANLATTTTTTTTAEEGFGGAAYGGMLMLGYLGFDGFTSTFQQKLFEGYKMSSHHQVLYVTLFSALFAFASLVSANMLWPALTFVLAYPRCIADILMLSATAVTSQFIIAHTIKRYGALVFAAIMTTRQLVSILLSTLLFGHPLHRDQWLGLGLVFGTLYMKINFNANRNKR